MSDFMSLPPIPFDTMNVTGRVEKVQHSLKSARLSQSVENPDDLKEACSELESLFIFHLLKEMRATIPKTGLMSGGRAEEIYTSMLDSQISKEMASQRGIGLSTLFHDRLKNRPGEVEEKDIEKSETKD